MYLQTIFGVVRLLAGLKPTQVGIWLHTMRIAVLRRPLPRPSRVIPSCRRGDSVVVRARRVNNERTNEG